MDPFARAGPSSKPARAIATFIVYQGRTLKASIDDNVPVTEIVAQLCQSVNEPAAFYCLRDFETDEIVSDANLLSKLEKGSRLKLVSSPVIEAADMVEKLSTRDDKTVKLATFELKRFIQEPVFIEEFVSRGGLIELVACIESVHGNALSYALASLQQLMESSSRGWESLDTPFIAKVVAIFSTQSLVNVVRPATGILCKLAQSSPDAAPAGEQQAFSVYSYGFSVLWPLIKAEPDFFRMLVVHLRAADHLLITEVIQLLVALMRSALQTSCFEFYEQLERNGVRQCIQEINDSKIRDSAIIPALVGFQECMVGFSYLQMRTPVSLAEHQTQLHQLWDALGLSDGDLDHLLALGLLPPDAFGKTGLFGLQTCIEVLQNASKELAEFVALQSTRAAGKECPIGHAADHVLFTLCTIWSIHTGQPTTSIPQPLLLSYPSVFRMAWKLLCRLWIESDATAADFDRLASVVDGFVAGVLREDANMGLRELEAVFANATYKSIRDQQMDEAALEDELLNKASIRNLRGRLYNECFELVRNQRIDCLLKGGWFVHTTAPDQVQSSRDSKRSTLQSVRWRYYRLATNRRMLHYCETTERAAVRPGLLDLPHSVDVTALKDILPTSARSRAPLAPTPGGQRTPSTASHVQTLTFGLYGPNGIVALLTAPDINTYAEWIDGLSLLRPTGYIHTKETAEVIQALCDTFVGVKLLDLTGEQVDVGAQSDEGFPPPPPAHAAFHYSEQLV